MMEGIVIQALLTDTAVKAIVSTRVYPCALPEGCVFPALTVTRVSGGPEYADDGGTGLSHGRLQIDCWADTFTAAKSLPPLVRDALANVTNIPLAEQIDERDMVEDRGAEFPYHVIVDFDVWERT